MDFKVSEICDIGKQLSLFDFKIDDMKNLDFVFASSGDILIAGEINGHKDIMYNISFTKDFVLNCIREYEKGEQ